MLCCPPAVMAERKSHMGSVIDYTRCPQCGGVYFRDYYYRTDEEHCSCVRCGKTYEVSLLRDDAGNLILDEKGAPQYAENSQNGYGAAYFKRKDGIGTILHFGEPVSDEIKQAYLKTLEDNPDLDISVCYLTAWDEAKGDVVAVFGEIPPLYEDDNPDEGDCASEEVPKCE